MSATDWNIVGVLALICAILASARIGVFEHNNTGGRRILGFALVFGNCFLPVALGYILVKWLVT